MPQARLIPIGSSVRGELSPDFDPTTTRAKYGAGAGDLVVVHFGFINHTKGVDILLAAARLMVDSGVPVKLWLIGGRTGSSDPTNAAYADQIERKAAALGLTERMTWTGFLDDAEAAAAFAACDVAALLFTDGASYRRSSLMAAIQHGCAIVTTEPAVDISVFRDGTNMRLVRPGDVQATAVVLCELSRDAGQIDRLKQGVSTLAAEFAWDEIARSNADFFERVISEVQR